jgi:vacuolar-type H+-ATPase subunit I/STV1
MSALDVLFGNLMTLAAVLVLLKVKKVITWDWGIVLSPLGIVIIMKGFLLLLSGA